MLAEGKVICWARYLNPLAFGGLFEQGAQQSASGNSCCRAIRVQPIQRKWQKIRLARESGGRAAELRQRPHPLQAPICGTTAVTTLQLEAGFQRICSRRRITFSEGGFRCGLFANDTSGLCHVVARYLCCLRELFAIVKNVSLCLSSRQ